jgi:hypothetical protein
LIKPASWARNSGLSLWPCTADACWTAASIYSFSVSADIAMEQFISLGYSRQSMCILGMVASSDCNPERSPVAVEPV